MTDEATSVGKIQFDFELSKESISREMQSISKVFNSGFKNPFTNMGSQSNNFIKDTISNMTGKFRNFATVGKQTNKEVADSVESISPKMENLIHQMDNAVNRAEMYRYKLKGLEEQYSRLSENQLSSDRGMKLGEQILIAKERVQKYGDVADRTRIKIEDLENSMNNLGSTADRSNTGFKKAERGARKTSKSFKDLGNEATKSSRKVGGFSNMITSTFMRILKRIFIINLIYKAIRGLMNYMNGALKTNREFSNSLNTVKTNLKVAFQPIYDFILPALQALMRALATITGYIASFMSALFGKTYQQSFKAAKGIETAKKELEGYGSAAKKAAKDAKGALAGFDEINQLDIHNPDDDAGGGGGLEMEMPETVFDFPGLDSFKALLEDLFKPFKLAWDTEGLNVINAFKDALGKIKDMLAAIGKSWMEVWTNGTGEKILTNILGIIKEVFNLVGNLAESFTRAWENNNVGTSIIQGLADILNIVLDTIKRIVGVTAEWAKTLDFTPLLQSIDSLLQALAPLTQNIGDGLVWFWENALLPLAGWAITDLIPSFLDLLASALGVLNSVIDAIKPLGKWLWDEFLQPLAEWTGGVIVATLEGLSRELKLIGDWINNHQKAVENIAIVIGSFAAAWGLVNVAIGLWNVIGTIAAGVTGAFGIAVGILTSPITLVIAAIGLLVAAGILLYKNWDEIKAFGTKIWGEIKRDLTKTWEDTKKMASNIWNGIKDFFTKIWDSIKTGVSTAWDNIKSYFTNLWDGLKKKTEEIWNGIKEFFSKTWADIKAKVEEVWNNIKKYILDKWDEIKTGITNKKNDLVNSIMDPFNAAKEKINTIIGDAKDWGKNLIGNFIDGIKSMTSKVGDAASGVVGKVADFIRFRSPSKEGPGKDADTWMPNFMDMIAEGISNNIGNVKKSIMKTANVLGRLSGITPSISMGAGLVKQPELSMTSNRRGQSSLESNAELITDLAHQIASILGVSNQSENGQPIYLTVKIGEHTLLEYLIDAINRQSRINGQTVIKV